MEPTTDEIIESIKFKIAEELDGELDSEKIKRLQSLIDNCESYTEFNTLIEES